MKRARDYWPAACAVVVLAGMIVLLGRAYLARTDHHIVYALDDSYIQMAIAKNLAVHGTWGVTPHEFTGAGTSLLWPWLLAVVEWLTERHDITPFLLNVVSALAVLLVAEGAVRRHTANIAVRLAVLLVAIVATPLAVLPYVGMEHTLQCVLALALARVAARLCAAATPPPSKAVAAACVLAAATVAIRYDTASVVAAAAVAALVAQRLRVAAALLACGALPAIAYAAAAARHGRPLVPLPILLKQRVPDVEMSWHGVLDVLGGGGLTVLADAPAILVLVLVASALLLSLRREAAEGDGADSPRRTEARALLGIFVAAALLHVQFGRLGWLHRYEAYLVVLGITAIGAAASYVRVPRPRSAWSMETAAALVLIAAALHPLLLRGGRAWRDVLDAGAATYRHQYRLSVFLQRYPRPAVLTYLAPTYYTDVPVVDLSGLGSWDIWRAYAQEHEDPTAVSRAAERIDARMMVIGTPDGVEEGWSCVASWTPAGSASSASFPDYFYASDGNAAAALERDLLAFDREGIAPDVRLRLQSDGGCPPRPR